MIRHIFTCRQSINYSELWWNREKKAWIFFCSFVKISRELTATEWWYPFTETWRCIEIRRKSKYAGTWTLRPLRLKVLFFIWTWRYQQETQMWSLTKQTFKWLDWDLYFLEQERQQFTEVKCQWGEIFKSPIIIPIITIIIADCND